MLFYRWHISGEKFPSFRRNEDWFELKVLKRDNLHTKEELNSCTAITWTSRLFNTAGLRVSKRTHAGRVSGARIAEEIGVSEEQVS